MSLLTNFQDLANTVKLALDRKADKSSLTGKEDTANKVPSLSSSSTDTEYPSAKCVYDFVNKPRLPAEYQEVDYIESDGTGAYINTDYYLTVMTRVSGKIQLLSTPSNLCFFGGTNKPNYQRGSFELGNTSSDGKTYFRIYYANNPPYVNSDFLPHTFGMGAGTFVSVDDIKTGANNDSYALYDNYGMKAYLFCANSDNTPDLFVNGRIYWISFVNAVTNETQRHFIPCYRKSDNEIGMYDIANNQFYTNAGTGTFTKGNDVN